DSPPQYCPTGHRRSLLFAHRIHRTGGHIMTTTIPTPQHTRAQKSQTEILLRFVGWEFWRNFRMLDATFFVLVLPAAMLLLLVVVMSQRTLHAAYGTVSG